MTFSLFTVVSAQTAQTITITAVTNSADFQPGFPQKGSLASIFTTGLQGEPGIYTAPAQYPLSNALNGISVWINFLRAPILGTAFLNGYQQINVQVPWEGERDPLYVEVFQNGVRAHAEADQANGFSVFFSDANGYAIAQHAFDYSLVTPQNPAHPGEYIIAYGLNLAPVVNAPPTGALAPTYPLAVSVPPASEPYVCGMNDWVSLGSASSGASYVGLAPGTVGVYQINFQAPASAGAGDLPLAFVRTLRSNLFGDCHGHRRGDVSSDKSSRPVILPIR